MIRKAHIRSHLRNAKLIFDTETIYVREYFPISDEESLSIQASRYHYCHPKETLTGLDTKLYTHVEVYVGGTPLEGIFGDDGAGTACVELGELVDVINKCYN